MAEETLEPISVDSQPNNIAATMVELAINMGAVSTYKIETLKEGNWVAWRSRMITMLRFHHAYGHIDGTVPK